MADLTNTQKKSGLARFISEKTSHSRRLPTVWECHASQSQTGAAAANGRNRSVGLTLTRREQVQSLYRQVAEVNNAIQLKPEGQRYPDAKQADTIVKLTSAIRNMEQEVGIADRIAVLTDVIEWMRPSDLDKAKELTSLFDAYIKDKL